MTDETAAFDAVHYKESRPASHLYARQRQKDGIRSIDSSGYQVGGRHSSPQSAEWGYRNEPKCITQAFGGGDSLRVKAVESGDLIRFSWRVLDPDKAAALNDKKAEPLLLDPQAGVKLVVPTMEKVGQLRQSSTPEAEKSYWMAFSIPGRRVKPGDFVTAVIGQFHAIGLVVE